VGISLSLKRNENILLSCDLAMKRKIQVSDIDSQVFEIIMMKKILVLVI